MLSIFPDLLIYSSLGIALIRIMLGFLGVYLAFKILSKKDLVIQFVGSLKFPFAFIAPWILIVLFLITGGSMILGLYTQIACVVLAYLLLKLLVIDLWSNRIIGFDFIVYIVFILISLSFLFIGAGAFAVDLPF
jgi:uncharacterized membrane protein YphA (DoxX/SURF4 family)